MGVSPALSGAVSQVKAAASAAGAEKPGFTTAEGQENVETAEEEGLGPSTLPADALAGLTDAQLLEVFKQTSIFNVRSALAGNEALLEGETEEGMDR